MTIRSRPATSNANLPDPGALQPEKAKDESATEVKALESKLLEEARGDLPTDTIRTPQPLGPEPREEARGESATEDTRTPQPLESEPPEEAKDESTTEVKALESKLLEEARGESPTDTIRTSQPLGPEPREEARDDPIEDIRSHQPLESEPPEEAKDDPTEENIVPSQPLCNRLLVPNEATVETAKEDTSTANSQPLKSGPLVSGKAESPKDASTLSTPQPWGPEANSVRDATVVAPTPVPLQPLPVPLDVERLTPDEAKTQTRYKLKLEIDDCKKCYYGTKFIVNCDAFSLCVEPDEIENFFHRFEETVWFSDRQLMPMILSFNWPSTTLVLTNSYAPKSQPKINSASIRTRWPLNRIHDRVILPYCSEKHWTLFDVDLRHRVIQQYDSMADNEERLAKLAPFIEESLAYAMAGWHNQELTWTTKTKVDM